VVATGRVRGLRIFKQGDSSLTRLFGRIAAVVALAAILVISAQGAAVAGPRPGLWKVTTRLDHDGTMSAPDTQTNCVTAEQIKDPGKSLMPPDSPEEKCKRTKYDWTGDRLSWSLQCSGQMAISGNGEIDFDTPEHYRGKITSTGAVNGHPFVSTIMLEGQRVGECPKTSP
jgi:Protein of unknown function (DUF3617)